jgi:hypothetical protein
MTILKQIFFVIFLLILQNNLIAIYLEQWSLSLKSTGKDFCDVKIYDSDSLMCIYEEGDVRVYNLLNGKMIEKLRFSSKDCFSMIEGGEYFIKDIKNNTIFRRNVLDNKESLKYTVGEPVRKIVGVNSNLIYCITKTGENDSLNLIDLKNNKMTKVMTFAASEIIDFAIRDDYAYMYISLMDEKILQNDIIIYCISTKNKNILWRKMFKDVSFNNPENIVVDHDIFFLMTKPERDSKLVVLNAKNGKIISDSKIIVSDERYLMKNGKKLLIGLKKSTIFDIDDYSNPVSVFNGLFARMINNRVIYLKDKHIYQYNFLHNHTEFVCGIDGFDVCNIFLSEHYFVLVLAEDIKMTQIKHLPLKIIVFGNILNRV